MIVKNKTKKNISGLLIILILLPSILLSFPKTGYAIWGEGDTSIDPLVDASSAGTMAATLETAATEASSLAQQLEDAAIAVGKELLKAVAKRVLAEITKSTINWINGGFHGAPLFLENPQSFFNDVAKSELKTIVNTYGYNSLLYPFGKQFALNAINAYKYQTAINAQYSLSNVMNSAQLVRYRNDFNYGGWNAFLINTQYPQNNVLGFNMMATEELARNLQGTSQNAAQRVQSLLQQGSGFLSPQTCSTNPSYNNGTNEFQKPSFQYTVPYPELTDDGIGNQAALNKWNADRDAAKAKWAETNTCPGGLKNTTPGSVASAQIANALNVPNLTTALDGAVGNSLSAIFDALLNKFLGDGLSALASKVNPAPATDNWSYNGITLGSPAQSGTNSTWNSGPDQPIFLKDFKQTVNDAIESVKTELRLMYNDSVNDPGLYQMYSKIWPKAQELDKCIPGPDIMGLQDRMDAEFARVNKDLQDKASGSLFGGSNQGEADVISKELTSALKLFKDWIDNKMMPELPSSLIYMDSVKNITTLSQGMSELTNNRIAKNKALIRLQAIKTNLDKITTQPDPGSAQDQVLVSIWKQYQAGSADFSNTNTIESTRNKLSEAKDIYKNLADSMDPNNPLGCPAERTAKGWRNPGGPGSVFISSGKTEEALFCSLPIAGGYTHKQFVNGNVTYPEIPLVNGRNVLTYQTITIMSALESFANSLLFYFHSPMIDAYWSVEVSCDNIFNASTTAYKGDLPGVISETPLHADTTETLGNCKYSNGIFDTNITKTQCTRNTGTWGPLEPLGTCTIPVPNTTPVQTMTVTNTPKSDCTTAKGTWTAN